MAIRGQGLNGVCYVAWNAIIGLGIPGDVANHTLRLVRDGLESTPANSPFEIDAVNCPGLYKINLTGNEMNAAAITLTGKSSTANVSIVPVEITTSAS